MTFTTTLFKVLDKASYTVIDGYKIELIQLDKYLVDGSEIRLCVCDEENEWTFKDQEVMINDDGQFNAVCLWNNSGDTTGVIVTCTISHHMTQADIPN